MNPNFKTDEKVLKNILKNNIELIDQNSKLNVIVFYRNLKTKNLIMKNDLSPPKRALDKTNVIYEFTCPVEDCHLSENKYIGFTKCTLSRRLTNHLQNGSIKDHDTNCQNLKLNRTKIVENTKIIYKINEHRKLVIMESILINFKKPKLNGQETGEGRILKLWN